MAIELSSSEWKLAFADSLARNPRIRTIRICGLFDVTRKELVKEIAAAKKAFGFPDDCKVVSCYEAGRQGFWVHRCLIAMSIQNFIVEPTSMLVNRKARRAKTDRLDAVGIVKHLMRYTGGDMTACRMIRIPDADQEDARQLSRELHELKGEKTSHTNRIKGLLETQGPRVDKPVPIEGSGVKATTCLSFAFDRSLESSIPYLCTSSIPLTLVR